MKTILLSLLFTVVSASLAWGQSPGDVDPLFRPPPASDSPYALRDGSLTIAPDGGLFGVRKEGVARFGSDGNPVTVAISPDSFPDYPSFLSVRPDGKLFRMTVTALQMLLPSNNDGWTTIPSVRMDRPLVEKSGTILLASTVGYSRLQNDNTRDFWYAQGVSYSGANYQTALGGASGFWTGIRGGTLDGSDRLIIFGSTRTVDGMERLGLSRMLSNGKVDPTWNPGPDLGFRIGASNDLNGFTVAVGPKGAGNILALTLTSDVGGEYRFHLSEVNDLGRVVNRFPKLILGDRTESVDQVVPTPDGGCVLLGTMEVSGSMRRFLKVTSDGSEDVTFRADFEGTIAGFPAAWRAVLQPDGYLAVSGRFSKVNGVERPGLVRLFVHSPTNETPSAKIESAPPRIANGETLFLSISGKQQPQSTFQWTKNGVPIPGATNPGLSLVVSAAADTSGYSIVVSNSFGSVTQRLPDAEWTQRSRVPGTPTHGVGTPVPFVGPAVPLALHGDQGMWLGGHNQNLEGEGVMLMRVTRNGDLDRSFGEDGTLKGLGGITSIVPLPDGGAVVAGSLTRLGGVACQGFLELDARGNPRRREYPVFDDGRLSSVLRLADGGYLIAGWFQTINGKPSMHIGRLTRELAVDPSFHSVFDSEQFLYSLGEQKNGWLVAGGYDTGSTNPMPIGLVRILEDGSMDPRFKAVTNRVSQFIVTSDDGILVHAIFGPQNVYRLDAEGNWDSEFASGFAGINGFETSPYRPSQQMVLVGNDGFVFAPWASDPRSSTGVLRFDSKGRYDPHFVGPTIVRTNLTRFSGIQSFPDGTLLSCKYMLATPTAAPQMWVQVVEPDSDLRLHPQKPAIGRFSARLETLRDRRYRVFRRETLDSTPVLVREVEGDGYVQTVETTASDETTFLELRR